MFGSPHLHFLTVFLHNEMYTCIPDDEYETHDCSLSISPDWLVPFMDSGPKNRFHFNAFLIIMDRPQNSPIRSTSATSEA